MLLDPGRLLPVIVVTLGAIYSSATSAQSAREYLNTPVDTLFGYLDVVGSHAETAADSDLPLPNTEVLGRNGYATLLWSFPLGDKYAGLALSGGYATVKVNGPFAAVQSSGITDPGITFHANIFGAPALRLKDFSEATPQTYSSFHLTVNPPLGTYDRNSVLNTGTNRWTVTPSVNLSITRDKGVSWIDLSAGGRFFTANDAYQGNNQLSQNPVLLLSAYYSHDINIGAGTWIGVGVHYDNGGETFVNDVSQQDSANAFRPGAAVSTIIGRFRLSLRYENIASRPDAVPTSGLLSLRVSSLLLGF